jgi:broad specificity phosphatase PhoE
MRIHLVRHGHVYNPRHLVYASLTGFSLSDEGKLQADAVATRLSALPIVRIVSSPLERAVETAAPLAAAVNLPITIEYDLSEWRLLDRWAGHTWESLNYSFPTEVDAYLADPRALTFGEESLDEMATRCTDAIRRHATDAGDTVFMFHQDPVQAAVRTLLGDSMDDFHADKPDHVEVRSLTSTVSGWVRAENQKPSPATPLPTL